MKKLLGLVILAMMISMAFAVSATEEKAISTKSQMESNELDTSYYGFGYRRFGGFRPWRFGRYGLGGLGYWGGLGAYSLGYTGC